MEATLRKARDKRDNQIDKAQSEFDKALAAAYEEGYSLHDLHLFTGVSISTLRVKLKLAGVELRTPGRMKEYRRPS